MKRREKLQEEEIDLVCEGMYQDLEITEAEYQGKKVKLNDPIRGGSKKFYVYVKDGDKVKKVSFYLDFWKISLLRCSLGGLEALNSRDELI